MRSQIHFGNMTLPVPTRSLLCSLLLAICSHVSASYVVTAIPGLGSLGSVGLGLSEAGHVVGYSRVGDSDATHGFVWKSGSITDIGTLGTRDSFASAVNSSGTVVGSSGSAGFVFRDGAMTRLYGYGENSVAPQAINDNGVIVGSAYDPTSGRNVAARWTNGVLENLGVLRPEWTGFNEAQLFAVNSSGDSVGLSRVPDTVAVSTSGATLRRAFTNPSPAPLEYSIAYGINDTGMIVGQLGSSVLPYSYSFMVKDGALLFISRGAAIDVNNAGAIVGWNDEGAYLYQDGAFTDLDNLPELLTQGWTSFSAVSINDAGQIVGTARKDGRPYALLLTPVSGGVVATPPSLLLVLSALIVGIVGSVLRRQ